MKINIFIVTTSEGLVSWLMKHLFCQNKKWHKFLTRYYFIQERLRRIEEERGVWLREGNDWSCGQLSYCLQLPQLPPGSAVCQNVPHSQYLPCRNLGQSVVTPDGHYDKQKYLWRQKNSQDPCRDRDCFPIPGNISSRCCISHRDDPLHFCSRLNVSSMEDNNVIVSMCHWYFRCRRVLTGKDSYRDEFIQTQVISLPRGMLHM